MSKEYTSLDFLPRDSSSNRAQAGPQPYYAVTHLGITGREGHTLCGCLHNPKCHGLLSLTSSPPAQHQGAAGRP